MFSSQIPLKYDLNYYDYPLPPEEQIAYYPAQKRSASKLLVINKRTSQLFFHERFSEIEHYLKKGDLLVLNNTKVFPARLKLVKSTGGEVEALLFQKPKGFHFECTSLFKGKRLKVGQILFSKDKSLKITLLENLGEGKFRILLETEEKPLEELIVEIGLAPLPPYIKREPEKKDLDLYQTVYAEKEGSIAAPTAGFHFDIPLLEGLKEKGVILSYITLHVGYGTFAPIKHRDIRLHKLEPEYVEVSEEAVEEIKKALKEKRRIIAVGTTVTRTLEFLARYNFKPYSGPCSLYIYPDFEFEVVSALVTNFHLPKSSPLLLVCAFAGRDLIFKAYEEAAKRGYRFYSYGDATFIYED
ncbi:MAG: tRNA preQ1(34) S-adenosylmethionine ribosyltransferase-isomerase QueA [Caldimicrobium sp.]